MGGDLRCHLPTPRDEPEKGAALRHARAQVQERLTRQICEALQLELNTEDVAVIIDAKHMCVSCRGIGDEASSTLTADYRGAFRKPETRHELLQHIRSGE